MHKRLFTPGPTEVRPEILKELATPQIYHRAPEFSDLYAEIQPKLQKVLYTKNPVFLFTASSTGAMESAVTNCVAKRCLILVNGAFSKRWHEIALGNGVPCDAFEIPWDKAIRPEMVDAAAFDREVRRGDPRLERDLDRPGEPAPGDRRGRAALPGRLLPRRRGERHGRSQDRDRRLGDRLRPGGRTEGIRASGRPHGRRGERAGARPFGEGPAAQLLLQPPGDVQVPPEEPDPATPAIPQMFALNAQLTDMLAEGMDARFARHERMAKIVQAWAKKHFDIYPEEGYWSKTVTCIKNTRNLSISDLVKTLAKDYNFRISNGYGAIKEKTFRIAHMGDAQVDEIEGVLKAIETVLKL